MNAHIGEDAALYSLGLLDEHERAQLESHAASCTSCSALLAQAYDDVATIESERAQAQASPLLERRVQKAARSRIAAPRGWLTGLAVAAAFALALIPSWVAVDRNRTLRTAMNADEAALARIASAPSVQRASFMAGKEPMGKVLYGARGDWYYVVIMHPKPNMEVAYVHDGRRETLGTIAMHGASGTLYLPINHRMDELALMDGDRVVADAHLAY